MFNVKHIECVGFESRWKVKRVSAVTSTQTTEFSSSEMSTDTGEKISTEVQTENSASSSLSPQVDEDKLAEWLKRIYPSVKKELDKVRNSTAFRGYRLSSDKSDANCTLVQNINVAAQVKDTDIGGHVSALSWNSTNSTLAVSCVYKHQSWCYHEGCVAFYSLNNDDFLPDTPKLKLSTESCVMALEFHPVYPAVVAAGLYSGGIVIWNIQQDDEQVIAKINGHGEGITQLSWITDINSTRNHLLASSGLDGFLTLWNFSLTESIFAIKERHQIKSQLLPKQSEEAASDELVKNVERGVLCFDFAKHTPEIFLVGAEGGIVVQCSLLGTRKLKGSSPEIPVLDSTFQYYEAHKGEVLSVAFSPNRKDMFLTNGSDGEIRIYMIGQEEPAQVIFLKRSLNYVTWILYEEKIIAGCGNSGILEIFNVVSGKLIENSTKEKVSQEILTQMKINKAKTSIVAVGTDSGKIQIWRVPWGLFGNLA